MKRIWKIYKHTLLVEGEQQGWSYIGLTSSAKVNSRWRNGTGYKEQAVFWEAIKKYGWDNFSHEIIEDNLTLEQANIQEQYWIAYYHTWVKDENCRGYNMTAGGGASENGMIKIKKDDLIKVISRKDLQQYIDQGWQWIDSRSKESLNSYSKTYKAKHKEKLKAKSKLFNETHKEYNALKQRNWRAKHRKEKHIITEQERKEKIKEYNAKYRATHRELLREKSKTYNREHREYIAARQKAWREKQKLKAGN